MEARQLVECVLAQSKKVTFKSLCFEVALKDGEYAEFEVSASDDLFYPLFLYRKFPESEPDAFQVFATAADLFDFVNDYRKGEVSLSADGVRSY